MTREQIEALIAGCEGVTPGRRYLGAQNDALYISTGRPPSPNNDYPFHKADRRTLAKVYDEVEGRYAAQFDPDTIRKLCRLALLGLDAETVATVNVALAEVFDAGTVDAPSYAKGYVAGQEAMQGRAAELEGVLVGLCSSFGSGRPSEPLSPASYNRRIREGIDITYAPMVESWRRANARR